MHDIRTITERHELVELARELKVRDDWHEPDEQDLTARVYGNVFDNAMGPGFEHAYGPDKEFLEMFVELRKNHVPIAQVSLATLFAWASQPAPSAPDPGHLMRAVRRDTLNAAADTLRKMADER